MPKGRKMSQPDRFCCDAGCIRGTCPAIRRHSQLDEWHAQQQHEARGRWLARLRTAAGITAILACCASLATCVLRIPT